MTTALKLLKKNYDGNWFAIPENEEQHFILLDEAVQNAEFMSDEWYSAIDEFTAAFSEYARD